jgi:hypothetical protein
MSNYMSPSLEDLSQMEYQELYEIAMSDLLTRSVGERLFWILGREDSSPNLTHAQREELCRLIQQRLRPKKRRR